MMFTRRHKQAIALALAAAVCAGGFFYYRSNRDSGRLTLYGNVDVRQVSLAFNASERIDAMLV